MRQATADLLLLAAALIWGFGFVAQRMGMEHVGPLTFNGLRFLLGGVWLLPLAICGRPRFLPEAPKRIPVLRAGCWAGLLLFCGAYLQQSGLVYTTAGKAGFITDLYVILVPIFGLFFGQSANPGTWLGALLATAGLYLLSIQGDCLIGRGDLLVLAGTIFWALHVLLLGYLSPRTHPLRLALVQYLFCSLLSLALAIPLERPDGRALLAATGPVLYGGVCSVGIGYTLQVVAQRWAHPAHAAILLSLEAVFAAFAGWWLLDETIPGRGITGCGLMLAGMLLSQLWPHPRQDRT